MSRGKVAVGLSGGVDSSAAAALLLDAGYECIAVTMRHLPAEAANSCCSLEAVVDARRVAKKLGIPHYLVDVEGAFRHDVIEPFEDAYLRGVTPNPCALCNRHIKFGKLWEWARGQGADYMATGHYAQIRAGEQGLELWRGASRDKDQSYILYTLTQDDLRHVLFPIGHLQKPMVRDLVEARGLATARKPDSQELCFVPKNNYREYLRTHRPEAVQEGRIVDSGGREVGRHQGIAFHTVGQRRGLGVQAPVPLYVLGVNPEDNEVVVGPREEGLATGMTIRDVVGPDVPASIAQGHVQVRAHGHDRPASWTPGEEGAEIRFESPEWGVTPGQVAVLYEGDRLRAGGRITRDIRRA
jgi:tRNA-specific 2-thiouridylase